MSAERAKDSVQFRQLTSCNYHSGYARVELLEKTRNNAAAAANRANEPLLSEKN